MKNKNYRAALILFGIVLLSTHITSAQLSKGPRAELAAITKTNPATGWIYFKDNLQLTPEALFHQHKQAFALKADDEMRFDRSMEMHLTGMQQYKYQQYYKNIKVHGAVANLYLKDGLVVKANGRLVHDLHKNTAPAIGEEKAIRIKSLKFSQAGFGRKHLEVTAAFGHTLEDIALGAKVQYRDFMFGRRVTNQVRFGGAHF